MEYNLPTHTSGDTFFGVRFVLSNQDGPINLTGAVITLITDKNKSLSSTNGKIVITDAAGGAFQIPEQIINWPRGYYRYNIRISFPTGRVRIYVRGRWMIRTAIYI
jgi:hypothetical protein